MSKRIDTSIDVQKLSPVILDDILNELRAIRKALVDQGLVVPILLRLSDGEERVVNDNPTTYYKDVDIMNRGPGTIIVKYETLIGPLSSPKTNRSVDVELESGEVDSLSFNEPRIGRIWIRSNGASVVKMVFTA